MQLGEDGDEEAEDDMVKAASGEAENVHDEKLNGEGAADVVEEKEQNDNVVKSNGEKEDVQDPALEAEDSADVNIIEDEVSMLLQLDEDDDSENEVEDDMVKAADDDSENEVEDDM